MAIFISAGHHNKDSGAVGSGYQENKLTIEFRDLILEELRVNFPKYKVISDTDSETLSQYLKRIKPGNGSVVVEIHFDSFNGKAQGTTALVADYHNKISKDLGNELVSVTANLLGTTNRGVKTESESARGRLAFVRQPGATVLMELEFIDNKAAIERYHRNKVKLAKEYARVLAQFDDKI